MSSSAELRRFGRFLGALGLAALLALASLGAAQAAAAHGGDIVLTVAQDGRGGVIVRAVYQEDGHPVSEIIDPVLTAQSDSGNSVGPVPLVSAPEGQGIWATSEAVLSEGSWDVVVEITSPSSAQVRASIDVVVASQTPSGESDTETTSPSSGQWFPIWAIVGVAAVGVVAAVLLAVASRRRHRDRSLIRATKL